MTECNGCGACCNPVHLPYSIVEAAKRADLQDYEKWWVLNILVPIPISEAKERAPHLFLPGKVNVDQNGKRLTPHYYLCGWYDEETRQCTNWEERPDVCRGYPFYGGPPDMRAALPPTCSFRADLGQPVEPLPVTFIKKSERTIQGPDAVS